MPLPYSEAVKHSTKGKGTTKGPKKGTGKR